MFLFEPNENAYCRKHGTYTPAKITHMINNLFDVCFGDCFMSPAFVTRPKRAKNMIQSSDNTRAGTWLGREMLGCVAVKTRGSPVVQWVEKGLLSGREDRQFLTSCEGAKFSLLESHHAWKTTFSYKGLHCGRLWRGLHGCGWAPSGHDKGKPFGWIFCRATQTYLLSGFCYSLSVTRQIFWIYCFCTKAVFPLEMNFLISCYKSVLSQKKRLHNQLMQWR